MTKVNLTISTMNAAYIEKIMTTPFDNLGGYVAKPSLSR